MSNKLKRCFKLFIAGIACGIAISYPYLLPFYILGYCYLIVSVTNFRFSNFDFLQGLLFGFGFFLASMHWIVNPFLVYEEHKSLAPFVLIIFPLAMGSFFSVSSVLISGLVTVSRIDENYFLTKCWLISLFLFSSEYLRSFLFGGLPLNLNSHLWAFNDRLISIASFIGVFGLSFLTIFWLTLIALFKNKKRKFFFLILICFPLLLCSIPQINIDKKNVDEKVVIRVIQPNIPQDEKWNRSLFQKHLDKLLQLTNSDNYKETIVIWPEVALTLYLNENQDLINYIRNNIKDNTTVITGALRRVFKNKFEIFNSLYVLNNEKFDYYDKKRLVPFGEFIPLRSMLDFTKLTPGNSDFNIGTKENLIELKYKSKAFIFEPSICYEAIFQTFSHQQISLIINITNDAWFGSTTGPSQHLKSSILRAVEKGVPLVRSANSGISVIVNSNGKIVDRINLNKSGFIEQEINLGSNDTFFMKHGNKTIYILIIFIFIVSFFIDILIKKRKDLKI